MVVTYHLPETSEEKAWRCCAAYNNATGARRTVLNTSKLAFEYTAPQGYAAGNQVGAVAHRLERLPGGQLSRNGRGSFTAKNKEPRRTIKSSLFFAVK